MLFIRYINRGVSRIFSSVADLIYIGHGGRHIFIRGRIAYYNLRETSFGICPLCPPERIFHQGQKNTSSNLMKGTAPDAPDAPDAPRLDKPLYLK
jgi:hypothetical protein